MRRYVWIVLVLGAGLMTILSACTSNGDSQGIVPPTTVASMPTETATTTVVPLPTAATVTTTTEVVVTAVVSSPQVDVSFDVALLLAEDVELPSESLAPANGAEVTVNGTLTEPAELRLQLAEPPDGEAVPMAWHIGDDGSVEMRTGVWDAETNELVVMTTEFSGWIPDWLNPVSWVAGVIDLVADMVSGRTDPPGCGDGPPDWASFVPPVGTGTVHSCFQSNIDKNTGTARAEVYFKSNRPGFQAVSIPAGTAYTWVENQPDWIRPALATLTGTKAATSVVLPGGMATSFGFNQPELTTESQIAVYTTPGTIVMDGVSAAVGLAAGADSGDIVAITVALNTCAASVFGVDIFQSDFTIGTDLDTALTGILACALEVIPELADPDKALDAVISLDDAGLIGPAPAGGYGAQLGALIDSANALGKIAERASTAFRIAGAGVYLWDKILDNSIGNDPALLKLAGTQQSIELRSGGLGPVDFGSDDQRAIDFVAALVGDADSDTRYDLVPLTNPWQSYDSDDYYAYGDGPDFAYRSFVTPYLRETCWRDELCLILGSDDGGGWVFLGWDFFVSQYDAGEGRSELGAETADGISPGTTLGEVVDRYPSIDVRQVETEEYELTLPGWERPSAAFYTYLEEFYDLESIPASYFDPSLTLSRLMAGVQVSINIG